jgi:hypothetical protein
LRLKTVVIQSAPNNRPPWVTDCLLGVEAWSIDHEFAYQFFDDSFFDVLPDWYRKKVSGRGPILADLARLLHIRAALETGADRVIWCDADTLIIDRSWQPSVTTHSRFGEEHWLQRDKSGRLEIRRQPHNAFMIFLQASPVLNFLIHTIESMIARVDPDHIAPQMVGPKLLKALHNLAQFDLEPDAGAMSPLLLKAIREVDTEVIHFFLERSGQVPKSFNLCASLIGESDLDIEGIRQQVADLL